MKLFAFPKPEHLCRQRDIEALFSAGSHALTAYPVRAVYRPVAHDGRGPAVQVLISVAKRRLHHAVDRNRAKRQLREAYRLNKATLLSALPEGRGLHVGFIWLATGPVKTATVENRVSLLLNRMAEKNAHPAADTARPEGGEAS